VGERLSASRGNESVTTQNVNGSPGEGPGHSRVRPCPRPHPERPPCTVRSCVPSFTARVQRRFADGTRLVYAFSRSLAAGSGTLGVCAIPLQMLLWVSRGILGNTQISEETQGVHTESSSRTSRPNSRRESPAGSRSGPARYVEVGGRGGNGWRQRRPPAEGAGNDRRSRSRRRSRSSCRSSTAISRRKSASISSSSILVSLYNRSLVRSDRPLSTGTCLLRRITGSGRPMLGDSAALSAESGEVRYGRF
jgi:hypothetical protein